jgi:hypothetical protein
MALDVMRTDERDGMYCQSLINPLTRRVYAIVRVPGLEGYVPTQAGVAPKGNVWNLERTGLRPLPAPNQPGDIQIYARPDEARHALEVFDAVYG